MITDQSVRIQQLEGYILRLTVRVLDLQGQVLALAHPQPQECITEVSDLLRRQPDLEKYWRVDLIF